MVNQINVQAIWQGVSNLYINSQTFTIFFTGTDLMLYSSSGMIASTRMCYDHRGRLSKESILILPRLLSHRMHLQVPDPPPASLPHNRKPPPHTRSFRTPSFHAHSYNPAQTQAGWERGF